MWAASHVETASSAGALSGKVSAHEGSELSAYIIRRLLQLVLVLFGVTLITFLMLRLVPGDPAIALAGKNATPARIEYVRHERGLDRSFVVQYYKYVGALVHGDLGTSLYTGRDVAEMIWEAAPVTIQLAVAAVLIELLGIPLGVFSALRQYSFWDTTLTTAALIMWGIPVFVLGYFAMFVFGLKLNWLPVGGVGGTVLWIIPSSWTSFTYLILPALTLGVIEVAYISYMQRAAMLEVIRSDYIRTARAKGLSERKVIWGHGFKNAVIPVMTIAGIDLGALIGGAIITETVFNRPGIGLMIYHAIGQRDTAVIAAGVLFATFFFVFANLLVDLGYAWVDPRVRLGE
jgi:peptide/nickel transport system permease protein